MGQLEKNMEITVQLNDWQVIAASESTVTLRLNPDILTFTAPVDLPEDESVELVLSHGGYVGSLLHCSVLQAHPLAARLSGFIIALNDRQRRVAMDLLSQIGVAA